MPQRTDRAVLVSMWLLLIIVLGVAVSEATPVSLSFGQPPVNIHTVVVGHGVSTSRTTVSRSTSSQGTASATTGPATAATSAGTSSGIAVPPPVTNSNSFGAALTIFAWYALTAIVIGLGAGMAVMLIRKQKPDVYDLKVAIEEMENQRKYFTGTWSQKMRNAALLRYYLLMAQVCAGVGVEDRPTDTPHEFIGRASMELKMEGTDSAKFADMVDRAHYGAELSEGEVMEAAGFMESFTRVVVGRVGLG